ncbi:MAG: transporter substrate-binding domain-containing protein [Candidatus Pacebacteria bacterium]|nr:transporter substrate-binding domain-containing protein [Candidatus Paceibacterota bacterium]
MKRKVKVAWIPLLIGILLVSAFAMASVATPQEEILIVSGHEAWSPVMYYDSKTIVGIGPDLVKNALSDYQVFSQYKGAWDVVQEKAKTGEIDIIVAVYKTEERQEYLLYSKPYLLDPIGIFTTDGSLLTLEDALNLKKGVITLGDSYGEKIDALIKENHNLLVVKNPDEAKEVLLSGEADYFLYSIYSGENLFKEELKSGEVTYFKVGSELFYVGVSKANPDAEKIVQILNEYINENCLLE